MTYGYYEDEAAHFAETGELFEPGALIAAGGWCAPSDTTWNVFSSDPHFNWDYVNIARIAKIFETGIVTPKPPPPKLHETFPKLQISRGLSFTTTWYDDGPFSWDD